MNAVLAAFAGTIFGLVAKFLIDLATEHLRNKREDALWRREQYVEASAQLLTAASAMAAAGAAVGRAVRSQMNAEHNQLDPDTVRKHQESTEEAWARLPEPTAIANHSVGLLRLYAPEQVVEAALRLDEVARKNREPSQHARQQSEVHAASAVLVEAVRASF